jgi:hypothetical protein
VDTGAHLYYDLYFSIMITVMMVVGVVVAPRLMMNGTHEREVTEVFIQVGGKF